MGAGAGGAGIGDDAHTGADCLAVKGETEGSVEDAVKGEDRAIDGSAECAVEDTAEYASEDVAEGEAEGSVKGVVEDADCRAAACARLARIAVADAGSSSSDKRGSWYAPPILGMSMGLIGSSFSQMILRYDRASLSFGRTGTKCWLSS